MLADKPEAARALIRHKAKVDVLLEAAPAGSSTSGAAASAASGAVGQTPLFYACASGRLALVKALIDGGANVNFARKEDGVTALMIAAEKGHGRVADALLAAGANRDAVDCSGQSARAKSAAWVRL